MSMLSSSSYFCIAIGYSEKKKQFHFDLRNLLLNISFSLHLHLHLLENRLLDCLIQEITQKLHGCD